MKTMRKKLWFLLMVIVAITMLTGCSGPDYTYKQAQRLLSEGKYAEAAEKFGSIGGYEDSAQLTMYCKACAIAENGDYATAISALEKMGDYKDCVMRIAYYKGRENEAAAGEDGWELMEIAVEYYDNYPLFLDSSERSAALSAKAETVKNKQYQDAVTAGESGQWDQAADDFARLGDYKDSADRIPYYRLRKQETELAGSTDQDTVAKVAGWYGERPEYLDCEARSDKLFKQADEIVANKYGKVADLIAEGKCAEAKEALANFGDYGSDRVNKYYIAIAEKYIEQRDWDAAYDTYVTAGLGLDANKAYYAKAETLMAENKWDEASDAFVQAGNYSDAKERINEPYYRQAENLLEQGKWDEASMAFAQAGDYKDAQNRINEPYYRQAEQLLTEGRYTAAYTMFRKSAPYADSDERADAIYDQHKAEILETAVVGEYVGFGAYEQDGKTSNGAEVIDWIVLAREDGRILVISRYVLGGVKFNEKNEDVWWVTSSARTWLNGPFFTTAFSTDEKMMIPTVEVSTTDYDMKNVNYLSSDKVFLLSAEEAEQYFADDDARMCQATPFAKESVAAYHLDRSPWWLRSSGAKYSQAATVVAGGAINSYGDRVHIVNGYRPVIWIEFEPAITGADAVTAAETDGADQTPVRMTAAETAVLWKAVLDKLSILVDDFAALVNDSQNIELTTQTLPDYEKRWKALADASAVMQDMLTGSLPAAEYEEQWVLLCNHVEQITATFTACSNLDTNGDGTYTSEEVSNQVNTTVNTAITHIQGMADVFSLFFESIGQ